MEKVSTDRKTVNLVDYLFLQLLTIKTFLIYVPFREICPSIFPFNIVLQIKCPIMVELLFIKSYKQRNIYFKKRLFYEKRTVKFNRITENVCSLFPKKSYIS